MEKWKDIENYEGLYQISNIGNVKSFKRRGAWKTKLLNKNPDKNGYFMVYLSKDSKVKTFKIHRLVATHFVKNINNYKEINHKDGDKQNNNGLNLEWCTYQQNKDHAVKTGLVASKINIFKLFLIEDLKNKMSLTQISKYLGVSIVTISRVLKERSKVFNREVLYF